jgi:hypothetical protein
MIVEVVDVESMKKDSLCRGVRHFMLVRFLRRSKEVNLGF